MFRVDFLSFVFDRSFKVQVHTDGRKEAYGIIVKLELLPRGLCVSFCEEDACILPAYSSCPLYMTVCLSLPFYLEIGEEDAIVHGCTGSEGMPVHFFVSKPKYLERSGVKEFDRMGSQQTHRILQYTLSRFENDTGGNCMLTKSSLNSPQVFVDAIAFVNSVADRLALRIRSVVNEPVVEAILR